MIQKDLKIKDDNVLVLGITFKENCPDVRNTKIVDVVAALKDYGVEVSVYDPLASPAEVKHEYNLITSNEVPQDKFDAIILGVAHKQFLRMDLALLRKEKCIIYDVKGVLSDADGKL